MKDDELMVLRDYENRLRLNIKNLKTDAELWKEEMNTERTCAVYSNIMTGLLALGIYKMLCPPIGMIDVWFIRPTRRAIHPDCEIELYYSLGHSQFLFRKSQSRKCLNMILEAVIKLKQKAIDEARRINEQGGVWTQEKS